MTPKQVKNDILAVMQTEKYFAEIEFYRLLDDNSLPHATRIEFMRQEMNKLNQIVQTAKVLDVLLPEKKSEPEITEPNPQA